MQKSERELTRTGTRLACVGIQDEREPVESEQMREARGKLRVRKQL